MGRAYEPQTRESIFRLYYNDKLGLVAFNEGIRTIIVRPVTAARAGPLPGAAAPAPVVPAAKKEEKPPARPEGVDLFEGFGFK